MGDCEDQAIYLWYLLKQSDLEEYDITFRVVIGKLILHSSSYHARVEVL